MNKSSAKFNFLMHGLKKGPTRSNKRFVNVWKSKGGTPYGQLSPLLFEVGSCKASTKAACIAIMSPSESTLPALSRSSSGFGRSTVTSGRSTEVLYLKRPFYAGCRSCTWKPFSSPMQNADDVTMKAALQVANEVIEGVDAAPIPPRERDPSFVSAFYYHAKGQALSLKAIYYRNKGNQIRAKQDLSLSEPMLENFTLAKRYYLEAADCLAEDDEGHAVYLNAALEMMWSSKTSARDQLAVMERIRLAIPKMKQIWAHSALATQGGDMLFKRGLEMETELRQGVESGEFQLDDPVTLQIED
ncbi:hypothetical protein BT96DRAFT_552500 [Gymnopus androsaceus JB14]|uniref:Uncharacterized protein n=1 Tax=Gymnopus androsaceus JB14 TaxID=1447944 RepID=A0A6A4I0S0_9AGAR|nr:hypothetical protein BT96DRAFT_552500 [Gymnopus androsaceus JB14]